MCEAAETCTGCATAGFILLSLEALGLIFVILQIASEWAFGDWISEWIEAWINKLPRPKK